MKQGWRLRAVPGALIILAHLVVLAFLVRHAGTPSDRDEAPAATYVTLALVPATTRPRPVQAPEVTLSPSPSKRSAAVQRDEPAPTAQVEVPAAPPAAQEGEPEQAAPQGGRLDIDALRAAARRVEQERVPTALERLRESEQVRGEDDSALVRGIQHAKRPKCQTAYSGGEKLNLIMLIPLVIDTVRDKGCKW